MEAITFLAVLGPIRTSVDGGLSVTLHLAEYESETVKKLLDARNQNLQCAIVAAEQ